MTREEAIDIIRDTYHTGTELEALKVLVPELKENEDERTRKELIELISCMHDADPRKKGWLDWLEKQKEQIPYIDFVIKPHKGDDTNPYDMSVPEAQYYAIKRGFGIPFNDGEVYVDERHITQTVGNILRWADEHPKEQKPSINIDQLKSLMLQYLQEAANEKEDSDIEADTDKWARKILGYDFEQKPAGWSEEDEHRCKDAIYFLETAKKHYADTSEFELTIEWLKLLRPQSKDEIHKGGIS